MWGGCDSGVGKGACKQHVLIRQLSCAPVRQERTAPELHVIRASHILKSFRRLPVSLTLVKAFRLSREKSAHV